MAVDLDTVIQWTARAEQLALMLVVTVSAALFWRARRVRRAGTPSAFADLGLRNLGRASRPEWGAIVALSVWALALRYCAPNASIPATIYGSELPGFRLAEALAQGQFALRLRDSLHHASLPVWEYDSPLLWPILFLIQKTVGVRLHTGIILGSLFGTLSVFFTWWAGRSLFGSRIGLLWAGLVAVSPLNLAWSRLGYRAMEALPHILLVLWLGHCAGRRRSILLAVATAAAAFATIYNYEAARLAMPLAFVAVFLGRLENPGPRLRAVLAALFLGLLVPIIIVLLVKGSSRDSLRVTLWPQYGGYAGNRGETTLGEWVKGTVTYGWTHLPPALSDYFVSNRTVQGLQKGWHWGAVYGGVASLAASALGLAGLYMLLREYPPWREPRTLLLWSLLAIGLVPAALGCSTARRLLVLDLAWQGIAAFGLAAWLRGVGAAGGRAEAGLAATTIGAMGLWSLALLACLTFISASFARNWPTAYFQAPFATGCVADVHTCPRCVQAAETWEWDIREGARVVLLDSNRQRENPTGPAGLTLFGHLAAMTAGKPRAFIDWYSVLNNWRLIPFSDRPYYERPELFGAWWTTELSRAGYQRTVWQSEQPNQWDRSFAYKLAGLGGLMEPLDSPLGRNGGFRVWTNAALDPVILKLILSFRSGPPGVPKGSSGCVTIEPSDQWRAAANPPMVLAAYRKPGDASIGWASANWSSLEYRDVRVLDARELRALNFDPAGRTGTGLAVSGQTYAVCPECSPSALPERVGAPGLIGYHCAARVHGSWVTLDPVTGQLQGPELSAAVRAGPWIGLGTGADPDELLLVSPEGRLAGVDLPGNNERFNIPARAMPNAEYGECTMVVAGKDWIGVVDQMAKQVCIFHRSDEHGAPREAGVVQVPGWPLTRLTSAAGADHTLAVGTDAAEIQTWTLDFSGCTP